MKFTVSQSALVKALAIVSKGMGTHTVMPILAGIYVRAENGTIELQTTDASISVRHLVPANVDEPGETVVSGKVLQNIAKNLSDAAITFVGEGETVTISSERSTFRLHALNPRDFPSFPQIDPDRTIELPSGVLARMVDKVYKVTSKEASRPVLQGVLLTVEDNTIRLVATDSFRLAVCDSFVEAPAGDPFQAIVPGSVFHDVLTMPSLTDTIVIGTTQNQVVFSFGNTTFVSRRIEGNFPNYKSLLSPTCNTAVGLRTQDFSSALKRVSVVAQQNSSVRLDVDPDGALVRLSASSPDQGDSTELVSAEVEGQPMAIALNYRYVLDCLGAVSDSEDLRLELIGATSPCIFKVNGQINYLYLLMPVRL